LSRNNGAAERKSTPSGKRNERTLLPCVGEKRQSTKIMANGTVISIDKARLFAHSNSKQAQNRGQL
jgi:hypothetical protein